MEDARGITLLSTLCKVLAGVLSAIKRSPVTASHKTIPAANTSERRSTAWQSTCSGAIYDTFPLNTPCAVSLLPTTLAIPKSTIFTTPS